MIMLGRLRATIITSMNREHVGILPEHQLGSMLGREEHAGTTDIIVSMDAVWRLAICITITTDKQPNMT